MLGEDRKKCERSFFDGAALYLLHKRNKSILVVVPIYQGGPDLDETIMTALTPSRTN